ncbi:MAG: DUF808 domain-containing protein, partial [Sulfurimonas sp.]
ILGDDLAVNAQKASGFAASRELPVLWAISKGSLVNKAIILPFAFILSAFAPWSIVPILMLGGIYLALEGAEKIYEYFRPHTKAQQSAMRAALSQEELLAYEAKKIKSAITTDFILSIEIIIIALGTVMEQSLPIQIVAVTVVALLATIGVYGIVALIIRMDDVGLALIEHAGEQRRFMRRAGEILVQALPKVIKALTVVGTLAMLLVAGGIFVHNVQQIHEALHSLPGIAAELLVGLVVGAAALATERVVMQVKARLSSPGH